MWLNSSYLFMCYLVKFILIYNIAWFTIYTNVRIALLLIPQPQHTNKYKSSLKICGYFILVLLGTKHTVKIIHTWAHVIIGPKLNIFFYHIRIVWKFFSFILILEKFAFHKLIFQRAFRSIIFLIVTPMPIVSFITKSISINISQRCFSIFEQSLHFTNFRLIISVSIFFFFIFSFGCLY